MKLHYKTVSSCFYSDGYKETLKTLIALFDLCKYRELSFRIYFKVFKRGALLLSFLEKFI